MRRPGMEDAILLDNYLRSLRDVLLRPLAYCIGGLSPNMITVLAAIFGIAAAGAAALQLYWLALVLWIVNRMLDGLDGMVARNCGLQSDFGGYLDIVLDFVVYAAIPIGLYWGAPSASLAIAIIVLLGSFYVNAASWIYLSAILEKRSAGAGVRGELTTVTMPGAIIGGTETILFYTAFLIWPAWIAWLALFMAGLVFLSVAQRLWWAYHHLALLDETERE